MIQFSISKQKEWHIQLISTEKVEGKKTIKNKSRNKRNRKQNTIKKINKMKTLFLEKN